MATKKQKIAQKYNWMLLQLDGAKGCLQSLRFSKMIAYDDEVPLGYILWRIRKCIQENRDILIAKVDEDERARLDGTAEVLQTGMAPLCRKDGRGTTYIPTSSRSR